MAKNSILFQICLEQLVQQILLPVALGLSLNKYLGTAAQKHKSLIGWFDKIIIFLIIYKSFSTAFLSAFVILSHLAIKSYDLVVALTGGGPGRATEMPATFMYSYTFTRNQMGIGASSAVIMLMTIAAIMVPYLYAELKEKKA